MKKKRIIPCKETLTAKEGIFTEEQKKTIRNEVEKVIAERKRLGMKVPTDIETEACSAYIEQAIMHNILTKGIIREEILTPEQTRIKKSKPTIPVTYKVTEEQLHSIFNSSGNDDTKIINGIRNEILSDIKNEELKYLMNFECHMLDTYAKTKAVGSAISCAYRLGRNVMLENLRPHLRRPTGADAEANKPMRLKYGEMYHDRILDNGKKGMGDRATKDNPVTAKIEASIYILDTYKKDTGKKCSRRNLELWLEEYRESLKRNN